MKWVGRYSAISGANCSLLRDGRYQCPKTARGVVCLSPFWAISSTRVILRVDVARKAVRVGLLFEGVSLNAPHGASNGDKEGCTPGWSEDLRAKIGMLSGDEISLLLGLILVVVGVRDDPPLMTTVGRRCWCRTRCRCSGRSRRRGRSGGFAACGSQSLDRLSGR